MQVVQLRTRVQTACHADLYTLTDQLGLLIYMLRLWDAAMASYIVYLHVTIERASGGRLRSLRASFPPSIHAAMQLAA